MIIALAKRLAHLCSKLKQEVSYRVFGIHSEIELSPSEKAFFEENSIKWANGKKTSSNGYILIEGMLADYGPNYLYRTGLIAKAIESKYPDLTPVVVYDQMLHMHKKSIFLYRSFGFFQHYSLSSSLINQLYRIYAGFLARRIRKKCKTGDDLLLLNFKGVHVGDLIYDSITSSLKKYKSIDFIQDDMGFYIKRALYEVLVYNRLFRRYKPAFLVSTHPCYINYGTLCRVALKHNARVILTTDIEVVELEKNPNPEICFTPVFHEFVGNFVKKKMKSIPQPDEAIKETQTYLQTRLSGKIDQVDVQLAYGSKSGYSEEALRKHLSLTENKPIVFIFAHIIADAPHCSHFLLFKDYYVWLKETLKICKEVDDVYWLVKPHPAVKAYSEDGIVETLVGNIGVEHIKCVPADYNTNSAFEYAKALITINGTAGLEFSCFGVPVILAGRPFYSELGFCIEPKSLQEYSQTLKDIKNVGRLNSLQIREAFLALAAFRSYSINDNMVLTADMLMKVWGYKDRDIQFVFSEMAKNLSSIDPRIEPQYRRALEIV